jgi:hypothetical protein
MLGGALEEDGWLRFDKPRGEGVEVVTEMAVAAE